MKDITRIHIAKVPYNIELSAKKELEKYINALEAYTADSELMQEIEIRVTELLLERGVKQEDVITTADVEAVREQLGEPKEFMTDEAAVGVDAEALSGEGTRKLYRNLDSAVIGGVLSGIASYLHVNALWVRLAFIVLIFVSFGFFVLLYFVAWLIIPPARTAAEKLQMSGRPVTLSSIRELNDSAVSGNSTQRAVVIKRILTIILGIAAIVTAFVAAAALFAVGIEASRGNDFDRLASYQIPMILMAVSGVLLIVLALLVAIAAFAQKFNKRIWVSSVIIIALGLVTSATAFALGFAQQQFERDTIQQNTVEVTEKLPVNFSSVTSLSIDIADATNFTYIVDTTAPSMRQRMLKDSPKAKIVVENGVAKISLQTAKERLYGAESSVTIYGPAVESILVANGYVSYDAGSQAKLKIEARNSSVVSLGESRIDLLEATLGESVQLSGDNAAVSTARLFLSGHPDITLGNIKALTVKSPDACAAHTTTTLSVQNILSATYDYNGTQVASRSMEDPCFEISVASEDAQLDY